MECTITRLVDRARRVGGAFGYWRTTGAPDRLPGQGRGPRHGRHRQGLRGHLQLLGVLRRRARAGLRGRRRPHRHGVRPVPPDGHGLAARRPRPPRDRGRPRRGRDPPQQGRRAVHVEVPARGSAGRVRRPPTRRPHLGHGAVAGPRRPTPAGRRSCRPATTSRGPSTPRSARAAARRTAASSSTSATCPPTTSGASCPRCTTSSRSWPTSTSRRGPMEVGPTTHYVMGGIRVDAETGAATVPGLFAAGEVAGGMHGANRLGGNSLSDLLVFGARTGAGARGPRREPRRTSRTSTRCRCARRRASSRRRWSAAAAARTPTRIQRDLQDVMQQLVGIFRVEADLAGGGRRAGQAPGSLAGRRGRAAGAPSTRAGTSSSSCAT